MSSLDYSESETGCRINLENRNENQLISPLQIVQKLFECIWKPKIEQRIQFIFFLRNWSDVTDEE